MDRLEGKVAFITGGASGIGFAMAEVFAREGMRIAIADVNETMLETAANALRGKGATVLPIVLDVRNPTGWHRAAATVQSELGQVQLLCNNAGIGGGGGNVEDIGYPSWQQCLDINLNGIFHGLQTFLPQMKTGEGHVVNTASFAGICGVPMISSYVASKFAVVGLSHSLRAELSGSKVGVSVLCPCEVQTNITENSARILGTAPPDNTYRDAIKAGTDPLLVAEKVLKAVRENRFFIITHLGMQAEFDSLYSELQDAMSPNSPMLVD